MAQHKITSSIKNSSISYLLPGISIVTAVFFLFYPAFTSYFFQDDWFSFSISQAHSFVDFIHFFLPRTNLIYYRPLGMQVPFFLVNSIFGINSLPFRVATFFIHLFNGLVLFKLLYFFVKNKWMALFGAFWYLTSATQVTIFYWAATFAFVLIPAIYFTSFLLFLNKEIRKSWWLFIVGFFVNELIITFPAVITIWVLLFAEKKRNIINTTFPFWAGSFCYGVFRLTIGRFTAHGGYQLIENIQQPLTTIRNFLLWSFNWPEQVSDQFVKFFKLNTLFVQNFAPYVAYFMTLTIIMVFFYFLIPAEALLRKQLRSPKVTTAVFGLLWFFITISPVLIFKNHAFSYYVPIPLLGILVAGLSLVSGWQLTYALSSRKILLLLGVTTCVWYFSAYKTVRLDQFIHWAPQRAVRSWELTTLMKKNYPTLPGGTIILVHEHEENKWALSDQSAFQVLYQDDSLFTFYGTKKMYFEQNPVDNETVKKAIEARMIELK